jgi:chaperonin GroES
MRLLDDRLAVVKIDKPKPADAPASSIIIPDSARQAMEDKLAYGSVRVVGEGKRLDNGERRPMEVTVDEVVVFNKYSGYQIEDTDGETVFILNESDILAIL